MKAILRILSVFLLFSLLVPAAPAQAEGENGYSLRFYGHGTDGIDRLRIPVDPPTIADTGQDFTIEFWLRALPGENNGEVTCNTRDGWITGNTIFDRDLWGEGDYGDWGISLSQGKIAFGVTQGTRGTTLCGNVNVADGVWHHIAITRHFNGLMRIYVDGWLDRQGYGPKGNISYRDGRIPIYPNDPYLVIGAEKHDAGSEFPSFSGWLDEIRLSTFVRYTNNFPVPTRPFTPDAKTALLYHFDEAAGAGTCNATIPDASGHVDAECLYGGGAPAGPVYSPSTPFATQKIAIPSYFYPPSFWTQLINSAPTVGLSVINPEDGPGADIDPPYLDIVQQAQSNGIVTLGYVATGYGLRSLTTVQNEIQRYFNWYNVNGIFLDEASNDCRKAAYYQRLYAYVKRLKPGAYVVLNPGTNTPECYIKAADILLNFEGDFNAYQNWIPDPWVYKYNPQRFWHLVHDANQSQMSEAIRLSKGRHAGWVYVTDDTALDNPWDTLPANPYWTEELNAIQASFWPNGFYKGVSYAAWWKDLYATPNSDLVLTQLLPADGVEWISLIVTCYQPTLASTTIDCSLDRTPTDDALIHAIQTAHAQGLKVLLKPHVDINDNSGWRGQINFADNNDDWNTWFANYTNFIRHYATLAEEQGVELFSIGCELEGTTHREADWRNVVGEVQTVYNGLITYAANWGGEETSIQWWDALDFIGVDAYYPLTNKNTPTRAELRAAWAPHIDTLSTLSSTWTKPILLTEIGYRSVDGANREPWNWMSKARTDTQEQMDCYLVSLDALAGQPWLKGIFWWNWSPTDPAESNPRNRRGYKFYLTDYAVYRKPAESILRTFYMLP